MSQNYNHAGNIEVSSPVEHSATEAPQDEVASYKILTFSDGIPERYKSLIFATWLNSLRYGNDMFKLTNQEAFYGNYSKHIDHLVHRPNAVLRIAVLSDDEDVALGWSLTQRDALHYVFVKKDFRRLGIARSLVLENIKIISHITNSGLPIWQEKLAHVIFNPFY